MAWRIEFDGAAEKDLARLDKPVARRITTFLRERVAPLDDPRSLAAALEGSRFGELCKYRVWRLARDRQHRGVLRVLVVRVGNRSDDYQPRNRSRPLASAGNT